MDEIKKLTTFLYDRCPQMIHHNLAIIRGDRKNPTLRGPALEEYRQLYGYIRRLWSDAKPCAMAPSWNPCCNGRN